MPTVTTATNHYPISIQVITCSNPIQERTDIFVSTLAQHSIVQLQETFSESCRAANIRIDDRSTQLVEEVVPATLIARTGLALWSAVNIYDYRTLSFKLVCRLIEKRADFATVKRPPVDEFGLGELRGIETARFAVSPADYLIRRHIQDKDIAWYARRAHRKCEVFVVIVPMRTSHDAHRQILNTSRLPGCCVEQIERADALFICRVGELLSIP